MIKIQLEKINNLKKNLKKSQKRNQKRNQKKNQKKSKTSCFRSIPPSAEIQFTLQRHFSFSFPSRKGNRLLRPLHPSAAAIRPLHFFLYGLLKEGLPPTFFPDGLFLLSAINSLSKPQSFRFTWLSAKTSHRTLPADE